MTIVFIDYIEGVLRTNNDDVELRGTFLKGKRADLPTLLWFSDLVEPASSFVPFFNRPDNKILDVRNVWCLNYRNMGDSDHHESFDMHVSHIHQSYSNHYSNIGHFK